MFTLWEHLPNKEGSLNAQIEEAQDNLVSFSHHELLSVNLSRINITENSYNNNQAQMT